MDNNPAPVSAWDPLRRPVFRSLWTAALVSNIGSWMQTMGAGWLMTELTHSPVKVALVQAAQSLPMFLLALPAGVLADIIDRRRQLIFAQVWMLSFAGLLAVTTFAGLTTPWWLLVMTFLIGCGAAVMTPAWSASVQDWVPRAELQPAIALIALSINISRALGPALAGVVVAVSGTGMVFLLNTLSFLAVIVALLRWKRLPTVVGMPAERLFGGLKSGFRYARHAPQLQRVLLRALIFFPFASVVWALLPIIVSHELQGGASLYGVLLGCIGAGAVAGALLMPRINARIARDRLVAYASIAYALTCALLAAVPDVRVAGLALLLGGACWVAILASLQVAAQTALPPWVRGRGLAMYWVVLMGGMTAGSVGWGHVAERFGIPWALAAAAACLVISVIGSWRLRIGSHDTVDLTPSDHWVTPMPAGQAGARCRAGAGHRGVPHRAGKCRALSQGAALAAPGAAARRCGVLAGVPRHGTARALRRALRHRDLGRAPAPARPGDGGRPRRPGAPPRVAGRRRTPQGHPLPRRVCVTGGDEHQGRTSCPAGTCRLAGVIRRVARFVADGASKD